MTDTAHRDGAQLKHETPEERRKKAEQRQDGPPARPHMTVTGKPDPSPHDAEKRRNRDG